MYNIKSKWCIFVILLFRLNEIKCLKDIKLPSYLIEDDLDDDPGEVFFVFGGLMVVLVVRYLTQCLHIRIPLPIFVIFLGGVWGVGLIYNNTFIEDYTYVIRVHPDHILMLVIPTLIFTAAFSIDAHSFLKAWPQITIISIFSLLISAAFIGILMTTFKHNQTYWTFVVGMLFGVLCTPIYPLQVMGILKLLGHRTKSIRILLEGETIVGFATVSILYDILLADLDGLFTEWYHYLTIFVRYTFGGILAGFVSGKMASIMFNQVANDILNLKILTVVFPYLSYFICEELLFVSGEVCLLIMGLMLAIDRTSLSAKTDGSLQKFWDMVSYSLNNVTFLIAGVLFTAAIIPYMAISDYMFIFVAYILSVIGRFFGFVIVLLILKRTAYSLSVRNLIVLVWGGLKSSFSICLAFLIYDSKDGHERYFARHFLMYSIGMLCLSLFFQTLIMPILLKHLGLTQLTISKQSNMNKCVKYVFAKRERVIEVLKMDRFLSDANWPTIVEATEIKHPYKTGGNSMEEDDEDEDDDFFMGYRIATCHDCKKEVLSEPTAKQFDEMKIEARLRTLKAKKVSYTRQYEYGMLSKVGTRVLTQANDVAMDTDDMVVDLNAIRKLFKQKGIYNYDKCHLAKICHLKKRKINPPVKYYRRICYNIMTNKWFDITMFLVILSNMIPIIIEMVYSPESYTTMSYILKGVNTIYCALYMAEFLIKIFGYSWKYICKHGFGTYFKSFWNVFDFIMVIASVSDVILDFYDLISKTFNKSEAKDITLMRPLVRMMRVLKFLKLFRLCRGLYPKISKLFESIIDNNMAFAYDVGKGFITGENEVLDMLPQMLDNPKLIEYMKGEIEVDKSAITEDMNLIRRYRPWIAITVNTKQAIWMVLSGLKDAINELKTSGWADEEEYIKLYDSLNERMVAAKAIRTIEANSPKVIYDGVAWMNANDMVTAHLYNNATMIRFDAYDIVCSDGSSCDGILIVVEGVFKLTYMPRTDMLNNCIEFGLLPIVDYISTIHFDEEINDFIVPGNCIGELAFLTKRPYNCTIVAETACEAFSLNDKLLRNAMRLSNDPVNGLECRLWKSIGVRIAASILMEIPIYQAIPKSKLQYKLERSFVPDLSHFKTFIVSDLIEDIILLQGIAIDFHTRDWYTGPCYIPRTVQKLLLPNRTEAPDNIADAKLLIIPAKNVDAYEILATDEQMSEMADNNVSQNLQKLIQSRAKGNKKKKLKVRMAESHFSADSKVSQLTQISSVETEVQDIHID